MFWGMNLKTFTMAMYLAFFAGVVATGLGWVLPIVMWLTNKDQDASGTINKHGLNIVNFIISMAIYCVAALVLTLATLGFLGYVLFPAIGIFSIVVIIMAAMKANEGQCWPLPLSFKFIK